MTLEEAKAKFPRGSYVTFFRLADQTHLYAKVKRVEALAREPSIVGHWRDTLSKAKKARSSRINEGYVRASICSRVLDSIPPEIVRYWQKVLEEEDAEA